MERLPRIRRGTTFDHLHASGALHRDITPFNVYVVDDELFEGSRRPWTVTDEPWQVGQLAAGLLTGEFHPDP